MTQLIARQTDGIRARVQATEQERRSVARLVLETLAARGVTAAFGIPGGLISPVYDALSDVPAIRVVTTRHEGMAAYAAMGHAVVTGQPALVLTTSGPGITNALTGIAAAFAEEIPLIAIGGEVPAAAVSRAAIQDATSNALDCVAMLRTVTRHSARIDAPDAAIGAVEHAVRMATGARPGPVFLSLPLDVSAALVNRASALKPEIASPRAPDPDACREVAAALHHARRPLLVVGNGARTAASEVRTLAERLAIPVVTTPHAKGVFPDSHALCLGGIGLGGHGSAIRYIESKPDVVLIVGSRLGDYATNGWSIPLGGSHKTFQIDREALLIGRSYPVDLGVIGDAALALRTILAALPARRAAVHAVSGIERVAPNTASDDRLTPAQVFRALQEAFPDALWACDQGEHCAYAIHFLNIDRADQFFTMVGLASMGSGIGFAIGARHSRQQRTVIGICGDGGFAMHAGEVLTCTEHGIDLVLVVINDGRYNMVHHGFNAVYGRTPTCLPRRVADIAGVARRFGAIGVCLKNAGDLDVTRLRRLARRGRPVVLDVRIDADLSLSAGSRSAALRAAKAGGNR
jgi:acetolactate synthase-1/2/3 large subunit